jgi:hypothetical protein
LIMQRILGISQQSLEKNVENQPSDALSLSNEGVKDHTVLEPRRTCKRMALTLMCITHYEI